MHLPGGGQWQGLGNQFKKTFGNLALNRKAC